MDTQTQNAHFNVARLRHLLGDARASGFIDNVSQINAVAERSQGYVWRLIDEAAAGGNLGGL